MRDYDDDSIQHYAPLLRRIIILLAVIIAVPVVLWTITAFMRTYIAQPTIPDARPLLPVAAAAPTSISTTDSATSSSNPAPATTAVASVPTTPSAPPSGGSPASNTDTGGTGSIPDNGVAAAQPAAASSPWPASPIGAATPTPPAPSAPAPSVFPDPPAMSAQTQPAAAAPDTTDDALPPPDPIAGPVPMPRHRPSILALADGTIPLPRARPAVAPEPPKAETDFPAPYDPGIGGVR